MPEGDTIHKLAAALAPRLVGATLEAFALRGAPTLDLRGRAVEGVEARGKHLFIAVEGEHLVRTHLGMHGSWHRYARGEAWKRPRHQASVVLETQGDVFVCFLAKEAECVRAEGARAAGTQRRLGPDLTAEPDPDEARIAQRARHLVSGSAPLADVLLHQGVACGIGNVYKCEVLFLHGIHPLRRLDSVGDGDLLELYRTARRLLRANLGGGARVTRNTRDGAGAQWVYGRGGQPCFRCAAPVERRKMGSGHRVTYWCPRCQT